MYHLSLIFSTTAFLVTLITAMVLYARLRHFKDLAVSPWPYLYIISYALGVHAGWNGIVALLVATCVAANGHYLLILLWHMYDYKKFESQLRSNGQKDSL